MIKMFSIIFSGNNAHLVNFPFIQRSPLEDPCIAGHVSDTGDTQVNNENLCSQELGQNGNVSKFLKCQHAMFLHFMKEDKEWKTGTGKFLPYLW